MAKGKLTKGQTVIYKTLHRKQKIEQYQEFILEFQGGFQSWWSSM
jgi:hypothetical protein